MVDDIETLWPLVSSLLSMPLSSKYTTTTTTPPLSPLSWNPSSVPSRKQAKKASVHPVVVVVAESIVVDGPENIEPRPLEDLRPEFDGFDDGSKSMRKRRPGRIVVPEFNGAAEFGYVCEFRCEEKDLEVEGSGYCVASRRGGSRHVMEDGYEVITNILGDSKQAFFGVFDGHGGRAAVDTVAEKLGKNIIAAISETVEGDRLEPAIRSGYSTTDRDFISQGVGSGACVATALVKNRELYVSNAGDCRVVISRKGVASALTSDHIAGREDERKRIESLGGFVTCRNGIWRVHDSLAVSRAIGDANMKELVISEPETTNIRLTPDCEFLIIASDGLWDKVSNQEAVDVVLRHKGSIKSCKDLMDLSCRRGSRDDVTVMVVDLQSFVQLH